jgi:RNA polymerase sigma-70 factor (ECF subfamily)
MSTTYAGIKSRNLAPRLQRRDRAAWDELVAQEHKRLYNLHLRLCGDRDTASDLTQETFKSAFESSQTYSGRSQPGAWLYGVALNVNRNWRRRTGRHEPLEILADDLPDPDPSTEQVALLQEQSHLLCEAVTKLPEVYRRAVALRYFGGIPAVEIAAAEGVEAGTVRWRLHQGLRKLWAELKPGLEPQTKGAQL